MTTHEPSRFQILGYFEDLLDPEDGNRYIGGREVAEQPGREFGESGKREETLTAPIDLDRGHKRIRLEASPEHPRRVVTILQKKCGRATWTNDPR